MSFATDHIPARCTAQMRYRSPLGPLLLVRTKNGLAGAWFEEPKHHPAPIDAPVDDDDLLLQRAKAQLAAYFDGAATRFDLPLDLIGTPFQTAVWRELLRIERGRTCSYGDIAKKLGNPTAGRAVGAAVGRNPVSVIVPCHRVLGSGGSEGGYSGGKGLPTKRKLLALEGVVLL